MSNKYLHRIYFQFIQLDKHGRRKGPLGPKELIIELDEPGGLSEGLVKLEVLAHINNLDLEKGMPEYPDRVTVYGVVKKTGEELPYPTRLHKRTEIKQWAREHRQRIRKWEQENEAREEAWARKHHTKNRHMALLRGETYHE